mmetsp:Transcript_20527/g.30118  ORF Transcript_20527/g.30118 Transcript_20527/m.30118 type:complete len:328 (-) Transcript_20527:276-1259(-)
MFWSLTQPLERFVPDIFLFGGNKSQLMECCPQRTLNRSPGTTKTNDTHSKLTNSSYIIPKDRKGKVVRKRKRKRKRRHSYKRAKDYKCQLYAIPEKHVIVSPSIFFHERGIIMPEAIMLRQMKGSTVAEETRSDIIISLEKRNVTKSIKCRSKYNHDWKSVPRDHHALSHETMMLKQSHECCNEITFEKKQRLYDSTKVPPSCQDRRRKRSVKGSNQKKLLFLANSLKQRAKLAAAYDIWYTGRIKEMQRSGGYQGAAVSVPSPCALSSFVLPGVSMQSPCASSSFVLPRVSVQSLCALPSFVLSESKRCISPDRGWLGMQHCFLPQ